MTPSQKILQKIRFERPGQSDETNQNNNNEITENPRRSFLKKSALGGIALGGAFMFSPIEELVAQSTQKVRPLIQLLLI